MRNSKQFDEDLQLKNFDDLEKDFQEAKKHFEGFSGKMKCEEVSKLFPGFCARKSNPQNPLLYLKYPTYKVVIFNRTMELEKIYEILRSEHHFEIHEEFNTVIYPNMQPIQTTFIDCLDTSLHKNTELAQRIMEKFKSINIYSERWVTSAYFAFPIKVDENDFFEIIRPQYGY